MAFDYSQIANIAQQLLKEFGVEILLKVREEAIYNPATGKTTYGYLDQEFKGQVKTVGVLDQYDEDEVDGTLVQLGDQKVYLDPHCQPAPRVGDVLVIPVIEQGRVVRQENFEIVGVQAIRPAAVVVLFQIQARRD